MCARTSSHVALQARAQAQARQQARQEAEGLLRAREAAIASMHPRSGNAGVHMTPVGKDASPFSSPYSNGRPTLRRSPTAPTASNWGDMPPRPSSLSTAASAFALRPATTDPWGSPPYPYASPGATPPAGRQQQYYQQQPVQQWQPKSSERPASSLRSPPGYGDPHWRPQRHESLTGSVYRPSPQFGLQSPPSVSQTAAQVHWGPSPLSSRGQPNRGSPSGRDA